jgi:Tetraspanin family
MSLCTGVYVVQVCGGTALGVGFWMRFDSEPFLYVELFHAMPSSGPLVILDRIPSVFVIVGGSVALLSFLGCCGACADSACFLCIVSLTAFYTQTNARDGFIEQSRPCFLNINQQKATNPSTAFVNCAASGRPSLSSAHP